MILLRSFSFYLALAGLLIAALFVQKVMAPPPPSKALNEPAANPYNRAVAATGIIEAKDRNVSIGTAVPGLVASISVDIGGHVKKDDLLFQIDGRDLEALLDVQKANLEVTKANFERLKDQLERLEKVKDTRAISVDEIKTKRHDVTIAEKQIQVADATVRETKALIDRLSVRAPKDGTILQISIRVGEYLTVNSTLPAMVLGTFNHLQIRADIDEQNAINFTPESKATAFPRNNTQLAIPLTFGYVEPYVIPKKSLTGSSQERVDTRVLQVIYTFEKPLNFPLYVGQQVDVFIDAPKDHRE